MSKFYAAINSYGSDTGIGFANTWNVHAFSSRAARDQFVKDKYPRNLSARSIKRQEITRYIGKPKPFSGNALIIENGYAYVEETPDGYIGFVVIDDPYFHTGDYVY